MKLIEFPEQTIVIAKDQPEYNPLPAHRFWDDEEGKVTCCWKLSWAERFVVLFTGKIWHQILTFNQPLQPQLLRVTKPDLSRLYSVLALLVLLSLSGCVSWPGVDNRPKQPVGPVQTLPGW